MFERMGEGNGPVDSGHVEAARLSQMASSRWFGYTPVNVRLDSYLDFVERMAMTPRERIEDLGITVLERMDMPRAMWFPISRTLIVPPEFSREGWECALLDVMWSVGNEQA